MTLSIAGMKRAARRIARLRRDESGASAVEFGFVALPFFALMFAIIEVSLAFFAGQTLDYAVGQAARMIRTGQAQQQEFNIDTFRARICAYIEPLFDCTSGLKLVVQKYTTFDSIDYGIPKDDDGNLDVDEDYQTGHGGDIVVVRAYYEWPVFVARLGTNLADLPDGKHLLVSTAAFRNEPFPW